MLKLWKISFPAVFLLVACAETPEPMPSQQPQPQEVFVKGNDISPLVDNVIVAERTPYSIVYEYQDVRVDDVAQLAAMYCQDHDRSSADLENIILYKNNKRRATFYCAKR